MRLYMYMVSSRKPDVGNVLQYSPTGSESRPETSIENFVKFERSVWPAPVCVLIVLEVLMAVVQSI